MANIQQVKGGQANVTPCATCGKKSHGWWVQCQSCEKWHHFTCVGVDETIRDEEWTCNTCKDVEPTAVSPVVDNSMLQMVDLQKQFLDMVRSERESVKADREVQQKFLGMVEAEREAVRADRELQKEQLELQKQQLELMKLLVHSRLDHSSRPPEPAPEQSAGSLSAHDNQLITDTTTEALNNLTLTMNQCQQRDLMTFSGDPMAWPSWIADYTLTSSQGKFSDVQNVNRLRKALKDNAKAAVQPHLNRGTDAETIIETLKGIYGREEDLLNKEASDLLKLPAITQKYDEKLPAFNIKLKNFVLMAKSQANVTALNQPFIISELHHKFVSSAGHYDKIRSLRLDNQQFNIEDLSNYLEDSVRKMPQQILLKCNFAKFLSSSSKQSKQQALSHYTIKGEPAAEHSQPANKREAKDSFRCPQCQSFHPMWRCQQFKVLPWSSKVDLLRKNDICFKCLGSKTHKANDCTLKGGCRVEGCGGPHNTIMHRPSQQERTTEATIDEQANRNNSQQQFSASDTKLQLSHTDNNTMLFQIVPIKLYGQEGPIKTYAMLDPASSLSMMERSIYDKLQLDGVDDALHLKWTGGVTKEEACKRVSLVISSTKGRKLHKIHNVYARDSLALAPQCFNINEMKQRYKHLRGLHLENLQGAVPTVMIGLEHADLLAGSKTITGEPHEPIAMKTELGWVVFGKLGSSKDTVQRDSHYHHTTAISLHHTQVKKGDETIAEAEVKRYFSTEAFGITPTKTLVSEADQKALDIMTSTLKRVDDRYEIGLLWKDDNTKLPDSLPMAMKRLKSEERSLKNKKLLEWKNQEMQNIISKGYARIATTEDLQTQWSRTWTAPTFVVINENKHPPKPRNVTDVAAEIDGISLNKMLLKGPDNMAPLFAALFRLRQHEIAVNADVKEMFSQILIKPEDQQCQRILWRNGDTTQEPTTIIYQRMMFGPVCSPSCAQFIKNHHARLYNEKYPEAAEILINSTYVDDLFTSHQTVEEAFRVNTNAIEICKDMSFDLVGVQSNSLELIEKLPTKHIKDKLIGFDAESDTYITKVLGMYWEPITDNFTFVFKENECMSNTAEFRPTKRQVLSTLMKIFDPLGIIAKYTLCGKLVLQDIWRTGIDWDDPIPSDLKETWRNFITTIGQISKLRVPRHYSPRLPTDSRITLVVFADASEVAFAAVAYFRFESEHGDVHTSLVMAKSRVAPIKPLSIPQLELQAAVLGVRLADTIQKLHTVKIENIIFLSDSKCVLMWICSKKMKFRSFVAVRVGEILDSTTQNQWYHVGTQDNVADEATRPVSIIGESTDRWYQGSDFLKLPIDRWPISKAVYDKDAILMTHHISPPDYTFAALKNIRAHYQANWAAYCRVVAWMIRFTDACRKRVHEKLNFIRPMERERAEDLLFRMIQFEAYPEEVHDLRHRGRVAAHSKLNGFSPFMGVDGIIRMSSRAQRASTSYAARNPAILPNKHPLTDVYINYHHCRNMHMREETIIADTRSRAWIVNVRSAVRRVSANCQRCKNLRAKPVHPRMGLLPDERLQYDAKAFSHVGVDCFGPLLVKQGRSTVKRYGIIFTCLVYRAVYLELLTDLSLDQVILAIRSLQARRGSIRTMFSDNGTNFVGARTQLAKDSKETIDKYGKAVADQLNIDWKFIPAYSPWMGGAWERLIRSIKKSLEFTLQGEKPSEDTLRGALIQAELEMNRRPLTHNPVDHEDDEPLTPNHALFGSSGFAAQPVGEVNESDGFGSSKSRQSRHLGEKFHNRWNEEYLPTIMRRTKWFKDEKPIQLDDIVLLSEPDNPRRTWKKGRVIRLYHGPDNIIRTVDIKLSDGTLKTWRSVGRVAVLDVRKPNHRSSNS